MPGEMDYSPNWQTTVPHQRPELRSFPTNISSYFRRPTKVVKTSSRDNSPRKLARRRTTASHSTTGHVTAPKGSISKIGAAGIASNDTAVTTRPISWHPNSMKPTPLNDWTYPYQFPDTAYPVHFLTHPFATTEVNGLITPLSQPSSAQSCFNEGFTPLEEMQTQHQDTSYSFPRPAGYNALEPQQHNLAPQCPAYQPFVYRDTYGPDQELPWTYPPALDMYAATAPPTPDFLAVSDEAVFENGKPPAVPQSEDEVLVGMGLYDGPSPPNLTALHDNQIAIPYRIAAGKGLKLEETFQPSNKDDSEKEDDDDDDDSKDDDNNAHQSLGADFHQKSQLDETMGGPQINTLANQSFFFEDDPDEEQLLYHSADQHFVTPIWTDVYSGAPCSWI